MIYELGEESSTSWINGRGAVSGNSDPVDRSNSSGRGVVRPSPSAGKVFVELWKGPRGKPCFGVPPHLSLPIYETKSVVLSSQC